MIVVYLRDESKIPVKGGKSAIHVPKTVTLIREEVIATVVEISDAEGTVLASFDADGVLYFTEEEEVDS